MNTLAVASNSTRFQNSFFYPFLQNYSLEIEAAFEIVLGIPAVFMFGHPRRNFASLNRSLAYQTFDTPPVEPVAIFLSAAAADVTGIADTVELKSLGILFEFLLPLFLFNPAIRAPCTLNLALLGCRTWTRTKILASKGRCPTIRRSGNGAFILSFFSFSSTTSFQSSIEKKEACRARATCP
jgi:hypothetical protein